MLIVIANVVEESSDVLLYCLSSFSGPVLAIGAASIYTLIPYHNVLKEPCYWYEIQIGVVLAFLPFLVFMSHPMMTRYWLEFKSTHSKLSYFVLYVIACGTYISTISVYYSKWIGLTQPMPMNIYIGATITYVAITLATSLM